MMTVTNYTLLVSLKMDPVLPENLLHHLKASVECVRVIMDEEKQL